MGKKGDDGVAVNAENNQSRGKDGENIDSKSNDCG